MNPINTSAIDLGKRPWLVLGGGGMKGLAHLGVWRWLRENGWSVDGLIGCSIGALIATCIGTDMDAQQMTALTLHLKKSSILRVNRRAVFVNGIKSSSVFRGDVFHEYLEGILRDHSWGDLKRPVQVNAVDLATGKAEWFGTGARTDVSLAAAVYASAALPGIYPPADIDGRFFIDGAFHQALPMDRALSVGATGVIAVDAGAGSDSDAEAVVAQGMIGIQQRAASILIRRQRQQLIESWDSIPTIVIRPRLDGYGTFDFDAIPYFLEEGYRAAREALPVVLAGTRTQDER